MSPEERKKKRQISKEMWSFIKRSFKHGRDLRIVQDNTDSIVKTDIILFCTVRNEMKRIPFFLDYYRKLGVNHFVFVDNDSNDGFLDYVSEFDDISVWHTTASYKKSNFGMDWLNYLLRKYGTGHWCVTCDPDEFLIYPYIESRNLHELADFMERNQQVSLFTIMLDMYSDKRIFDTQYVPENSPFEVCPYFDKTGYVSQKSDYYQNLWVQGGVRRREFFADEPTQCPALNKTPFVKWEWRYSYISSMHMLVPGKLNRMDPRKYISGVICHFKFFSTILDKAREEMERGEHYGGSREYKQYLSAQEKLNLYNPSVSEKLVSWEQLEKMNLLTKSNW